MQYAKDMVWFIRESYSFMAPIKNRVTFFFKALSKSFGYANTMRKWYKLSAKQREDWYATGEGRAMEF